MKELSPKKKAALLGLLFIVIIPWIAVFVLDFFFIDRFPKQVYVHKKDFCFFLPENCQTVSRTSGDLDFYCQDGQSANLTFIENVEEYLDKATVKKSLEAPEVKTFDISYEGKSISLQLKLLSLKKRFIQLIVMRALQHQKRRQSLLESFDTAMEEVVLLKIYPGLSQT